MFVDVLAFYIFSFEILEILRIMLVVGNSGFLWKFWVTTLFSNVLVFRAYFPRLATWLPSCLANLAKTEETSSQAVVHSLTIF